jgi:hypothetical protein
MIKLCEILVIFFLFLQNSEMIFSFAFLQFLKMITILSLIEILNDNNKFPKLYKIKKSNQLYFSQFSIFNAAK